MLIKRKVPEDYHADVLSAMYKESKLVLEEGVLDCKTDIDFILYDVIIDGIDNVEISDKDKVIYDYKYVKCPSLIFQTLKMMFKDRLKRIPYNNENLFKIISRDGIYFNTHIIYSWSVIVNLMSLKDNIIPKIKSKVFYENESSLCDKFIDYLHVKTASMIDYAHEFVYENKKQYSECYYSQWKQDEFEDYVYNQSKFVFYKYTTIPVLKKLTLGATISQIVNLVSLSVIVDAFPIGEVEIFEIDCSD